MKAIKIIALVLVCAIVVGVAAFGIIKHEEVRYVEDAMSAAIATIKDGTWQNIISGSGEVAEDDVSEAPQIEFVAGTYGGVDFNSIEDVVNYYNTVYDATKAERADYKNADGGTESFYKMVGEEYLSLKPDSILVDGKANTIVNGLAPNVLSGFGGGSVNGLSPSSNRNPDLDVDDNGESLTTSRVTVDDIEKAAVVDNGDGTITIQIVPKEVNLSAKGMDAQGHFFNSLGALDEAVGGIDILSWASGTTEENVTALYKDGDVKVKIDVASGKIIEGDYHMITKVNVTHATLAGVIKDKSASLVIYYDCHFPASDEYLLKEKGLTRV